MSEMPEPREWLIRKGAYFYRPNFCGYTTQKDQAGRYTEIEARKEAAVNPWHMEAIHESELPDAPNANGTVSAFTHSRTVDALKEALADAIRRPMGVIPDSAVGLITAADLDAAEDRRTQSTVTQETRHERD